MQFIRKTGRFLSGGFLKLAVVTLAFSLAALSAVGSPEPIKASLDESGAYDKTVDALLEGAEREQDEAGEGLPLDQPEVQNAAKTAFNPDLLKRSADSFIDGLYGWLRGDTAEPEFTIDLSDAKQTFIQRVADQAETRLNSLPQCTPQQNLALASQDIDPFTVSCRPPVVISQEKQRLISELERDSEFLEDPVLTGEDLTQEGQEDFSERLSGLPDAFQTLKRLPVISATVGLVLAATLILLHDDRRRGIRQVGIIFLTSGLLLLAGALILAFILSRIGQPPVTDVDNPTLQAALGDVLRYLINLFNRTLIVVSIVYAVLGAGTLVGLKFFGKPAEPEETDEKPATAPDKPEKDK